MPPEETDPAQPDGQGGTGGDAPYQAYLDRIPEEARGAAEEAFRDFDANTTRKFQDAADYRKQWEPLEATGVSQRDPAEVQWAMQFVDALSDPTAIQTWFTNYAKENGLTKAEQTEIEQEYIDPSVQSLVEQRLEASLGPVAKQLQEMAQWRTDQEQQAREAQAMSEIRSEIDELKAKHGDEFDESLVEKLLPQYIDTDPTHAVARAFGDSQAIRSQIEKATLQGKADQPAAPTSGGSATGTPDPPPKGDALKHAAAQALEQLRANRVT